MIYLLWLMFFLGQVLFVLNRADLSSKSPDTPGTTLREWFQKNWRNVGFRVFCCTLIFMLWASAEPWWDKFLSQVGLNVFVGILPVPTKITLSVLATAGAFGVALEWMFDGLMARVSGWMGKARE